MACEPNRGRLLDFFGQACASSTCLTTLHVEDTFSSAKSGDTFLKSLATASEQYISSIEELTIASENWFEELDQVDPLIQLLKRQISLRILNMINGNNLSEEKQDLIRSAIVNPDECKCFFWRGDWEQHLAEKEKMD